MGCGPLHRSDYLVGPETALRCYVDELVATIPRAQLRCSPDPFCATGCSGGRPAVIRQTPQGVIGQTFMNGNNTRVEA